MTDKITSQELKELLHYDELTGVFTWKVRRKGVKFGAIAGNVTVNGYRQMKVMLRNYQAHRLVWLYMTGKFPDDQIDHINGVTDDNRFINLREVSNQENSRNLSIPKRNTSGVIGVQWSKKSEKWRAGIMVNQKAIHLGLFEDKEDAIRARKIAEKKYNFHENHGKIQQVTS